MRREFQEESLKIGGAFGVATAGLSSQWSGAGEKRMQTTDVSSDITIHLTVNGAPQAITVDVRTSLLDLLRERLHLTGTKRAVTTVNAAHVRCT